VCHRRWPALVGWHPRCLKTRAELKGMEAEYHARSLVWVFAEDSDTPSTVQEGQSSAPGQLDGVSHSDLRAVWRADGPDSLRQGAQGVGRAYPRDLASQDLGKRARHRRSFLPTTTAEPPTRRLRSRPSRIPPPRGALFWGGSDGHTNPSVRCTIPRCASWPSSRLHCTSRPAQP